MFRIPLLVALALAVAFGLGTFSAIEALKVTLGFGGITLGPWTAFPQAQTADADPYAKAHRARAGALLLGGAEGLAFYARTDSKGMPLDAGCTYEISGQTPAARFWTLHVTGPDDRPVALEAGLPTAINSWTVLRRADTSFSLTLSHKAQPDNWVALPDKGRFALTLTLLDTPTAGSSGVVELDMPGIVKTGCGDA
ncbi:DUF1214 domain-containing protein [Rhizobium sp. SG2393]|uniref:DUF1214 domain-containing protein n=1 Tax=Rhizobium sp. SG2393 TaxID=3276279 RepID=UPI003670A25D